MTELLDRLAQIDALRDDDYSWEEIAEELDWPLELIAKLRAARDEGLTDLTLDDALVRLREPETREAVEVNGNGSAPEPEEPLLAAAETGAAALERTLAAGPKTPEDADEAFRELMKPAGAGRTLTAREAVIPAPSSSKLRLSTQALVDRVAVKLASYSGKGFEEMTREQRAFYHRLATMAVRAMREVEQDVGRLKQLDRIEQRANR